MGRASRKTSWMVYLGIVLLFSIVLSGCAASNQAGSDQSNRSNVATNNQQAPSGEKEKEKTNISISMRTLGFTHVENHTNINNDPYVLELEELTNVDLDIRLVPHSEFQQKMDLMFASGDIPDVVQTSGGFGSASGETLKDAVEAGVFLALDDLIEEHGPNLKEKIPNDAWEEQKYTDGKIYAIPEFLANPSRRSTVVRADLLEKAGIPVPTKPEEAWTVEEALEVLRTFKEMGLEEPYIGRAEFKYSDTFFGAYDAQAFNSMWIVNEQNQPIPKFFNVENMEDALRYYKTMYDEGLIHREFLTHEFNDYKNAAITGKGGMWSMNANEVLQWQTQLQQSVPEARLAIIPSPVGPDGKGGYYLYGNVTRAYMINKDAEDKAVEIIKFLDWMLTEEAETFFTFGIEGVDHTVENGVINYKEPVSNDEVNIERYRTAFLWLVHDTTYFKMLLELTDEGKALISVYDDILAFEGRDGIRFNPGLTAWDNKPDLKTNSDRPPTLLMSHMAKMITGAEPIDWQKAVDDWVNRGGSDVLVEAKQLYDNGQYYESRR